MIPTYIFHLPIGSESGEYLALDLGGSNLRLIHVSILNSTPTVTKFTNIPLTTHVMTTDAGIAGYIGHGVLTYCSIRDVVWVSCRQPCNICSRMHRCKFFYSPRLYLLLPRQPRGAPGGCTYNMDEGIQCKGLRWRECGWFAHQGTG